MKKHQTTPFLNIFKKAKFIGLLLLPFIFFYLLGCKKDLSKADNRDANSNENVFIITNKANDSEYVFIYLQDHLGVSKYNNTIVSSVEPYRVKPFECLQVKTSQFENLTVEMGEFGILDSVKICGDSEENKCQPSHYEIVSVGDWIDDYILKAVDHPSNFKWTECIDIEDWMRKAKSEVPALST